MERKMYLQTRRVISTIKRAYMETGKIERFGAIRTTKSGYERLRQTVIRKRRLAAWHDMRGSVQASSLTMA
jgi:hypothetical protein